MECETEQKRNSRDRSERSSVITTEKEDDSVTCTLTPRKAESEDKMQQRLYKSPSLVCDSYDGNILRELKKTPVAGTGTCELLSANTFFIPASFLISSVHLLWTVHLPQPFCLLCTPPLSSELP